MAKAATLCQRSFVRRPRRFLSLLWLGVALCAVWLAHQEVYTSIEFPLARVELSVYKLADADDKNMWCTAWVVSPTILITAQHCDEITHPVIGDQPAPFVATNKNADLAAVRPTHPLGAPVLNLAAMPSIGTTVMAVGYALDFTRPVSAVLSISAMEMFWSPEENRMTFSGRLIPGMSGGPIINRHGDVVSIGQAVADRSSLAFGARWSDLQRFVASLPQ